jgi:hypothetical protein
MARGSRSVKINKGQSQRFLVIRPWRRAVMELERILVIDDRADIG